jgi:hypothetical protein
MATILSAGDIAIVGYNSDDPDSFDFVFLRDVEAGTTINFTDNGWQAAGGFRQGEGTTTFTAPTAIAAGTVISLPTAPMEYNFLGIRSLHIKARRRVRPFSTPSSSRTATPRSPEMQRAPSIRRSRQASRSASRRLRFRSITPSMRGPRPDRNSICLKQSAIRRIGPAAIRFRSRGASTFARSGGQQSIWISTIRRTAGGTSKRNTARAAPRRESVTPICASLTATATPLFRRRSRFASHRPTTCCP